MTAAELFSETFGFIQALTPFIFAFVVVAYADELIDVVRKAALGFKSRRDY